MREREHIVGRRKKKRHDKGRREIGKVCAKREMTSASVTVTEPRKSELSGRALRSSSLSQTFEKRKAQDRDPSLIGNSESGGRVAHLKLELLNLLEKIVNKKGTVKDGRLVIAAKEKLAENTMRLRK